MYVVALTHLGVFETFSRVDSQLYRHVQTITCRAKYPVEIGIRFRFSMVAPFVLISLELPGHGTERSHVMITFVLEHYVLVRMGKFRPSVPRT